MNPAIPVRATSPSPRWLAVLLLVLPLALVAWSFWPTFEGLADTWASSAQHSHGYLVPAFAALLLWFRRDCLKNFASRSSRWGWPLVALGVGLQLYGSYFYFQWYEQISPVPCLAGLVLLLGGLGAIRWAGPSIAFLAFMVPLPHSAAIVLTDPLQRLATTCSTFALQTLGLPAIAEGNVILLNDVRLGVVEACSGLRMLVIFFALSTAVALMMRRPWWERLAVVASAVPIALATNVLRITATGVLHETAGTELANAVFHDLAGWLMMPVALGFLGIEQQILKRVFLKAPAPTAQSVKVNFTRIAVTPPRSTRRSMQQQPPAPSAPAEVTAPAEETTNSHSRLQEACDETA